MKITELSATQLASAIRSGRTSSVEIAQEYLARAKSINPLLNAFLRVDEDRILAQARAVDEKRAQKKPLGCLAGVPVAVKDCILERGELGTCASKILANFKSSYDATVVQKLKAEDALLFGRTNMDEFAMGSSTENSAFCKTRNPWDRERIPGGSSGGSACAVAARLAPLALGSDTGGSIRQPAALCGIDGLKPTYGRVSRFGLVAFASSLDQIGPMANNVEDLALCLGVIEGHDRLDSTSANKPKGKYVKTGLAGLRLGVPKEYLVEGLDVDVEKSIQEALKILEKQGAKLVEVSLPHTSYAIATYYIIATAEASSNLERYDGVKYGLRRGFDQETPEDLMDLYCGSRSAGFGAEVKRRIILGTYVLSAGYYDAYYLKALKVRRLIHDDFAKAFSKCDAMVTPTSPTAAFKIGERTEDPLQMYLSDIFTISANLAGIPALSIPCGFTRAGLPVGLQVLGKIFDEATILNVAWNYEDATEHHRRMPSLG